MPDPIAGSRYSSASLKEINARTIPFLADFIKTMRKDSIVFVAAGPKLAASSLLLLSSSSSSSIEQKKYQEVSQFTVRDLALSRVFYQYQVENSEGTDGTSSSSREDGHENEDDSWSPKTDFVQLMFVSADNQTVHSVLIEFEIGITSGSVHNTASSSIGNGNTKKGKNELSLLSRSVKGLNAPSIQSKRVSLVHNLKFLIKYKLDVYDFSRNSLLARRSCCIRARQSSSRQPNSSLRKSHQRWQTQTGWCTS